MYGDYYTTLIETVNLVSAFGLSKNNKW